MAKFRTTKLQSHGSNTIPLFWFIQADEEQRENTESVLNKVIDRLVEENPQFKRKQVVGVPWLRNFTASLADVLDTARGFDMGEGHLLGIDAQSLEDESLLVLHCVNEKEPEIGRAARPEAVGAFLKEDLFRYTLAGAFDERPWTRIPVTIQSPEPAVKDVSTEYILPSHIPSDTRLQEERIVLFSLINLTDEEISVLKHDMGVAANEVTIYNWPHATPASHAETYNIFQCVKPEYMVPRGQTFVMFIDAMHLSGPERAPVVVVACESAPDYTDQPTHRQCLCYKHIYLHAERAQQVKELWPQIWQPPNRDSVNDVVVNYPLFDGTHHHWNSTTAVAETDWNSPVMSYHSNFIAKPGLAVRATGAKSPEFVVYILCPVTPEELRTLRNIIVAENGGIVQFLELDIVPRAARTVEKEETSEELSIDSSTRLDSLLEFFDTPAYRAMDDPPETFVFLDNDALDDLLTGASYNPSVPLATIFHHFHGNELITLEIPAYQYANFEIYEGLRSALANLATGNMFFWELVGCHSNGMDVAFWPEYRGSMRKEMLDIEWP